LTCGSDAGAPAPGPLTEPIIVPPPDGGLLDGLGACYVRDQTDTSTPLFEDPSIGTDYVKRNILFNTGGLDTQQQLLRIQAVCSDAIMETIMLEYCALGRESALQWEVTAYQAIDRHGSTTCTCSGCDRHPCQAN
jgi:hypothetical protein